MVMPNANSLELFLQYVREACCLALARAGSKSAAKMAMMAMTTSSSIKVKPAGVERSRCPLLDFIVAP